VLFAINVPFAKPEAVVAVGETVPNSEFVVSKKLTAVPSMTFFPMLSVSVADITTVPSALTVPGLAVSEMAATVVPVIPVVVGLEGVPTELLEHPTLMMEHIKNTNNRLADFMYYLSFKKNR